MKQKNTSGMEETIRRRVKAKFDERRALFMHVASYLSVNVMVWMIWLLVSRGFPWPIFVTFSWGIGMVGHLLDYYQKHGGGARKREEEIEAEVERQLRMAEAQDYLQRRQAYDEDDIEAADVYDLDEFEGRGLRLSDDGELIDDDYRDGDGRRDEHEQSQTKR